MKRYEHDGCRLSSGEFCECDFPELTSPKVEDALYEALEKLETKEREVRELREKLDSARRLLRNFVMAYARDESEPPHVKAILLAKAFLHETKERS